MRQVVDLNGSWMFQVDPKNQGEKHSWYNNGIPNPINVVVPHIWQREEGDYVSYNGAAWYERTILLEDINMDYYICFGAVDYTCKVWWNGHFIGEHEGGYTPFEFYISPEYLKKINTISIRVYDYESNAEIPIGKQGSWYTRVSGIWQSVSLESRAKTYITNVFVTPNLDNQTIEIVAAVSGDTTDQLNIPFIISPHSLGEKRWTDSPVYTGVLNEEDNTATLPFQEEGFTYFKTIFQASELKKWSPETPHLYEIKVSLHEDEYVTTFGYRKVEQKNGRVYVNDVPIYIRGALDQAFYPDTIYTAPSIDYIKKEIKLAKEMGFNLLRKHIKAEIPEYLYWADRLGILIWAEPPNYVKWTVPAQRRFVNTLKKLLIRDYNNPSIIIWSIYNEEWGLEWELEFDKEKQAHVEQVFTSVKKWDPTRLFCDNSGWAHVKTEINDHHRYFSLPEQLHQWKKDLDEFVIKNKDQNFVVGYHSNNEPLIVSEFGMWGLPSFRNFRNFYDGNEPWWLVNQGDATHQDDYKKPVTALENHSKFGIKEALGDFENIARLSQIRMFRGVKSLIEEMRKRPEIAGYVVTQFTDIEWETNGWLDYMRNPKEGFERFVDFNGSRCILAEIPTRNFWSGDSVNIDLFVIDDKRKLTDITILWHLVDENDHPFEMISGEIQTTIHRKSYKKIPSAISFTAPNILGSTFATLKLQLISEGKVIASNQEELTITKDVIQANEPVFVYQLPKLCEKMKKKGMHLLDKLEDGAIVITNHLDENILHHIQNGGHAIFLAEDGDKLQAKGQYTFRELDVGESWARASSMNYINTQIITEIPLHPEVGWEAMDLHPDYIIPFSDYKKVGKKRVVNLFGAPRLAEESNVIAGYFQGWLGQNGGSVVHHSIGKGNIMIVTWKICNHYGDHPIATQIMHKIINIVQGEYANEN